MMQNSPLLGLFLVLRSFITCWSTALPDLYGLGIRAIAALLDR